MNRYPEWLELALLVVLGLMVMGFVALRIVWRRQESVAEMIESERTDRVPPLSVRCPQCWAAPGVDCATDNDWGAHLARYRAADAKSLQR